MDVCPIKTVSLSAGTFRGCSPEGTRSPRLVGEISRGLPAPFWLLVAENIVHGIFKIVGIVAVGTVEPYLMT